MSKGDNLITIFYLVTILGWLFISVPLCIVEAMKIRQSLKELKDIESKIETIRKKIKKGKRR